MSITIKKYPKAYDYLTVSKDNLSIAFEGDLFDLYKLRKLRKAHEEICINPSTHEVTHVQHPDEEPQYDVRYEYKQDYEQSISFLKNILNDYDHAYFEYALEKCPELFKEKNIVHIDTYNDDKVSIEASLLVGLVIFNTPKELILKIFDLFSPEERKNLINDFSKTINSDDFLKLEYISIFKIFKNYETHFKNTQLFIEFQDEFKNKEDLSPLKNKI